ncbi:MAG: lysophospholipid acyltransferase family protein [Coprococcus sp.]
MIRTILIVLFLLCFFIISIPLYLIEEIIGHFDIKKKERSSFRIVTCAFRCISWLAGTRLIVKGREKVPTDLPVLYVSNHRSYFDIVTLYPLTNNTTGFVAKKEMEKFPFVHRWMMYMNCQFLDRDNIKAGLKTILDCIATVKNGCSICIFPEGTRTPGDEMLEFKEGSFKIAEKSGCPIIPVAITNTESIFENHMPFVKASTVVIEFGDPIDIKGLPKEDRRHIGVRVQGIIADMLARNSHYI